MRILDVVYNAVSNELVRTKTLTKNTIVQIDAQPFKQWYLKKYGVDLGKKKGKAEADAEEVKLSGHVKAKQAARLSTQRIDPAVVEQFQGGRLLASIASRPGQSGRCDGYVLEGEDPSSLLSLLCLLLLLLLLITIIIIIIIVIMMNYFYCY